MKIMMNTKHARRLRFIGPVLIVLALFGCSSLYLKDCPEGGVIGVDKPRIRSWRARTLLANENASAARFVDYAAKGGARQMRIAILLCLFLVVSEVSQAQELGVRPQPGSNNIWFVHNDSDTVFVFVHGILSDSRDAWYYPGDLQNPASYWPELVAHQSFGNPSVFLGGFYTEALSGDYTIRDAAEELYSHLSVSKPPSPVPVLAKKNIVFIAHSLGGIAVRYLLTKRREAFEGKYVGLVLVASPSLGAEDADRLSFALNLVNQKMGQQLKWMSPDLVELDRDFRNLADTNRNRSLVGIEAIENHFYTKYLFLFNRKVVVDEASGGRYFGAPIRIGGSDHSTIAKPKNTSDQMHVVLRQFYEQKYLPLVEANLPKKTVEIKETRKDAVVRYHTVFDGSDGIDGFAVVGRGAHVWTGEWPNSKEIGAKGEGTLTFESDGILNIQRNNTEGRYELVVQEYTYGGRHQNVLPKDELVAGMRELNITCQAKVEAGEHTLKFVMKTIGGKQLAEYRQLVTTNRWSSINVYMQTPATEDVQVRIYDEQISTPSSIQIKDLVIRQRKM